MKLDIGRVFSNTWEMIKQRFWLLLGLWAVFFGIQIVFGMVFGGVVGGSMFAMGAAAGGMDDPGAAMLGGLGIGFILLMIVFYVAYILIALAQQCAMAAMGSPLQKPTFGDALSGGFKSSLTFLGIILLFIVAYFAFLIAAAILGFILSFLGDFGAIIMVLLIAPVAIYLALRMSVIVPVVAVDKVSNPIEAIKRTWAMTDGAVLPILLIYIVVLVIAALLLGVPFLTFFGSMAAIGAGGDPASAAGAVGSLLGGMLLMIPLFIAYSIVAVVIVSCMHAELTDAPTEALEETFS